MVAQAHKAALEDFSTAIQNTQSELDMALLVYSGKGPFVPFTPPRSVEEQLASKGYRCWGLPNINLLAPISINMWKTWAHLTDAELKILRNNVVHGTGTMKEAQNIPHNFPLALFDHQKCNLPTVRILTKQNLQTGFGRDPKHSASLWNCERPYLRCPCKSDATVGCKGNVMWFDHAVYYMIKHLGIFFQDDLFPTLPSKFAAFLVWMTEAARVAVRHQVVFAFTRQYMCEAALEFTKDPEAKLLATHPHGQGIRNVIRLIKPTGYSISTPSKPTSQAVTGRRVPRINCNVEPAVGTESQPGAGRGGRMHAARSGRGNCNKKYRPTRPQAANPNEAFVFIGRNGKRSPATLGNEGYNTQTPSPNYNRSLQLVPSPNQITPTQQSPGASSKILTANTRSTPRVMRSAKRARALDWDNIQL